MIVLGCQMQEAPEAGDKTELVLAGHIWEDPVQREKAVTGGLRNEQGWCRGDRKRCFLRAGLSSDSS